MPPRKHYELPLQRRHSEAVVVVDDIFPIHPAQAERVRRTLAWTGDVWRLMEALKRNRPGLFLLALDTSPTGLLVIAGLDPTNRVLWNRYNSVVGPVGKTAAPVPAVLKREGAVDPGGEETRRVIEALKRARAEGCSPREIVARSRRALQS